jgi:DHA2 family multidrug resistance protein-like MFS transporter
MVDAYVVVYAALLLLMGAPADRYGRKLVLDPGLLVFLAASLAAAWAGSVELLIAARPRPAASQPDQTQVEVEA